MAGFESQDFDPAVSLHLPPSSPWCFPLLADGPTASVDAAYTSWHPAQLEKALAGGTRMISVYGQPSGVHVCGGLGAASMVPALATAVMAPALAVPWTSRRRTGICRSRYQKSPKPLISIYYHGIGRNARGFWASATILICNQNARR